MEEKYKITQLTLNVYLMNRKPLQFFPQKRDFLMTSGFFDEMVLQTLAQVLIFIYVGTIDFDKVTRIGRAKYLCKCLQDERFICCTGIRRYLFASSLQPCEFLIFNFPSNIYRRDSLVTYPC